MFSSSSSPTILQSQFSSHNFIHAVGRHFEVSLFLFEL